MLISFESILPGWNVIVQVGNSVEGHFKNRHEQKEIYIYMWSWDQSANNMSEERSS
jgi:hypothetical protein